MISVLKSKRCEKLASCRASSRVLTFWGHLKIIFRRNFTSRFFRFKLKKIRFE